MTLDELTLKISAEEDPVVRMMLQNVEQKLHEAEKAAESAGEAIDKVSDSMSDAGKAADEAGKSIGKEGKSQEKAAASGKKRAEILKKQNAILKLSKQGTDLVTRSIRAMGISTVVTSSLLAGLGVSAANISQDILNSAFSTGLNPKDFQEASLLYERLGGKAEDFQRDAAAFYGAYNTPLNLEGLKSISEKLYDPADSIEERTLKALKTAKSFQLSETLAKALFMGPEEIQKKWDDIANSAAVASDETLRKNKELYDSLVALRQTLRGISLIFGAGINETLGNHINDLTGYLNTNKNAFEIWGEDAGEAIRTVGEMIGAIAQGDFDKLTKVFWDAAGRRNVKNHAEELAIIEAKRISQEGDLAGIRDSLENEIYKHNSMMFEKGSERLQVEAFKGFLAQRGIRAKAAAKEMYTQWWKGRQAPIAVDLDFDSVYRDYMNRDYEWRIQDWEKFKKVFPSGNLNDYLTPNKPTRARPFKGIVESYLEEDYTDMITKLKLDEQARSDLPHALVSENHNYRHPNGLPVYQRSGHNPSLSDLSQAFGFTGPQQRKPMVEYVPRSNMTNNTTQNAPVTVTMENHFTINGNNTQEMRNTITDALSSWKGSIHLDRLSGIRTLH